jgi:NAD(P)-dependent dehydrogenase (short-subunit alcohol dehydrogenase family)
VIGRLSDRLVVVTGAGGALGPHVVDRLVMDGPTIAVADRDEEAMAQLDAADKQAVDLLDPAATKAWADGLADRYGHVDAVLHLVGGWRGGTPIADAPPEDWDLLHDLLIRTVQNTTRAFLPHLKASSHGRFVLVSSTQAQHPSSTNAAYATAKAAAETWTLAVADELSESGGTANILVVNAIVTPEMREVSPDKAYKTFTDARDMAEAIGFLVSDAAQKMNGQRLELHG